MRPALDCSESGSGEILSVINDDDEFLFSSGMVLKNSWLT